MTMARNRNKLVAVTHSNHSTDVFHNKKKQNGQVHHRLNILWAIISWCDRVACVDLVTRVCNGGDGGNPRWD